MGERYCLGPLMPFRLVWCSMVFVGAVIAGWDQIQTGAEFVWLLSDTLNAMMAMPNLIALAALSPIVFKLTQEFFTQEANRKRTRSNSVLTSVAMGCMALAVWPICMLDKSANLAITLTVCLYHLSIYVLAQAMENGLNPIGGEQ